MKVLKLVMLFLIVISISTSCSKKSKFVGVKPNMPNFSYTAFSSYRNNGEIDFEKFTQSDAEEYLFDFGDGSSVETSDGYPFTKTHKYYESGKFTVKLIVRNSYGESSITKQIDVPKYRGYAVWWSGDNNVETTPAIVTLDNIDGTYTEKITTTYQFLSLCDYYSGTAMFDVPIGIYNVTTKDCYGNYKYSTINIQSTGCGLNKVF
jgi:PKD repeat protein